MELLKTSKFLKAYRIAQARRASAIWIFWKICECPFIPNSTRNNMWLLVNTSKNKTLFSFLAVFYFVLWLTDSVVCFNFLPENFVEWSGFPLKNLLPALKTYVVTFSSLVRHFVSLCFRDLSIHQFYCSFLHCLGLIYLFSANERAEILACLLFVLKSIRITW